jgi:predicted transposase/invertase (TIGR01784 family)
MKKICFADDEDIIDPCIDEVFKATFTKDTPQSRGAVRLLLSAILEQKLKIITITANEPPMDDLRDRHIRYDICVKMDNGELANLEMTVNPAPLEALRLEYYVSKLYINQDIKGTDKSYQNLQRTYQISIFGKRSLFKDDELVHQFAYYDRDHNMPLGGRTSIITLELSKVDRILKKPVAEMTGKEQWAVFFRYCTDKRKRVLINEILAREEGIAMAGEVIQGFTQKELDYLQEMSKFRREMDLQSDRVEARRALQKVRERGRKAGFRAGRAEGLQEGLQDGRQEGRDIGIQEGRLEVARNFKKMGLPVKQIAAATGLPAETIAALQ